MTTPVVTETPIEPHGCEPDTCRYSAAHALRGIPATTTIHCGPIGIVPACADCANLYARLSA